LFIKQRNQLFFFRFEQVTPTPSTGSFGNWVTDPRTLEDYPTFEMKNVLLEPELGFLTKIGPDGVICHAPPLPLKPVANPLRV